MIGLVKNADWMNCVYYNQQRFINYTDDALSALGEQLRATRQMTLAKQASPVIGYWRNKEESVLL